MVSKAKTPGLKPGFTPVQLSHFVNENREDIQASMAEIGITPEQLVRARDKHMIAYILGVKPSLLQSSQSGALAPIIYETLQVSREAFDNAKIVAIGRGDRILIRNIPSDYPYRELYMTEGRHMGVLDAYNPISQVVAFTTGYVPFFADKYVCSGCGYRIPYSKLRNLGRGPASFWNWKDGIMAHGNHHVYQLQVNYFECDFNDIIQ